MGGGGSGHSIATADHVNVSTNVPDMNAAKLGRLFIVSFRVQRVRFLKLVLSKCKRCIVCLLIAYRAARKLLRYDPSLFASYATVRSIPGLPLLHCHCSSHTEPHISCYAMILRCLLVMRQYAAFLGCSEPLCL